MDKHRFDKIYIALTVIIVLAVAILIWNNK